MNNQLQSVTKSEIEKIGDLKKAVELNGVAKAAHEFYKAKDDQVAAQHAKEIYFRSARQAGFLLLPENMPRERFRNQYFDSSGAGRITQYQEALESTGITPHIANDWQKIATIEEREFEAYLSNPKFEHTEYTISGLLRYAAIVHVSDDSYEWNTPRQYIEAARRVMGSIDLDPATNYGAQEIIKAGRWYTKETDGLSKDWGGNIWINPPFSMPEVGQFLSKAVEHYKAGEVKQACILTNNSTDTEWFHGIARNSVFCLTKGRISFWGEGGTLAARQGQAIFYLGENKREFRDVFSSFGLVVKRYDD